MKRHTDIPVITTATIALFAGFLLMLMLCGCSRTTYVPVETTTVRTDTLYKAVMRVDTVVDRDTVRFMQRGDTVYSEVVRWRWRVKENHDTVYHTRVDSVDRPVPYPVEVPYYVERKLAWWQTGLMWAGGLLLTAIAGWLVLRRKINK